jgi:hypothetical protein
MSPGSGPPGFGGRTSGTAVDPELRGVRSGWNRASTELGDEDGKVLVVLTAMYGLDSSWGAVASPSLRRQRMEAT